MIEIKFDLHHKLPN